MAGNGDCWPVKIVRDRRIAKAFAILRGLGLDIGSDDKAGGSVGDVGRISAS